MPLPASLRTAPRLAAVTVLALAVGMLAIGPLAADAHGEEPEAVTPARVKGETRLHTAANLATLTFEQADVAHVVYAGDYPDALAASYAAGQVDGPVLLAPHDEVGADSPTMAALEELDVSEVRLVGGPAALSEDLAAEFAAAGYETDRIHGVDRYQTASAVAMRYGTETEIGTLEGERTALLASGETFADALASGPVAAGAGFPLLLTPPERTEFSVNTSLEQLDIERIVVVGGPEAVDSSVVEHYEQDYTVERWSGADRMATAATVADNAIERLGFSAELTLLARGDAFPDALAASVHGGVNAAPILLAASPEDLGEATATWLAKACPDVDAVRALGGTAAVSGATLDAAVEAAEACLEATTNQSYVLGPQEPITDAAPGYEQEFHLIGTYDDGPLAAGELALFPCKLVAIDRGHVTFVEDPDNPGHALGAGNTEAGEAWISRIGDVAQPEGTTRDRGFDPDGYRFSVTSEAPDCAVPVVWDSGGEQPDELPVDEDGAPTVRFGVGEITWTAQP